MTLLVLVILAVMWVVVLVPPLLRSRQESRPTDSVVSFRRQLSTLQRTRPPLRSAGRAMAPARMGRSVGALPSAYGRAAAAPGYPGAYDGGMRSSRVVARRRRQNVLTGLAVLTGACLVLAVSSGSRTFWYASAVAGVLLLGYLYLLVQMRKLQEQRTRTLRPVWYSAA